MKIAYLVLCHADPEHIARLSRKLTNEDPECGVFIHVDAKSSIYEKLCDYISGERNIVILKKRIPIYWGGFSAVEATYLLLHRSYDMGYHRFVILQGADYPIASPRSIREFFSRNGHTEFVRAYDTTAAKLNYLCLKPRVRSFRERVTVFKKVMMVLLKLIPVLRLPGFVKIDGVRWSVHWGAAQIAVTRELAALFLNHENNEALKRFFKKIHAPDEAWFQTIVYNSPFKNATQDGRSLDEFAGMGLIDARNLTYFEYSKIVTVFNDDDFEKLKELPDLFIRKVTTSKSSKLLERIDRMHRGEAGRSS